jgi:cytoskeleton protein RodZ
VVEGTMPTGFILLVAAVLAATAYGSWYYLTLHGRNVGDIVSQIPQQIAEIVGLQSDTPEPSAAPPQPAANTADQPAAAAAGETPAPAGSQEPPMSAAGSPASAQPESAAGDPPVEIKSDRQAEPADAAVTPAPSRPESASVTEAARDTAVAADDAPAAPEGPAETATAGDGSSDRSDSVETTTLPAPAAPVPVSAASLPEAAQSAALPEAAQSAALPEAAQSAALPGSSPVIVGPEPPSRVVLRATAISWVELRDANGKRVFSRLLKKGETYNVPGRDGITLATGNAGALDVLVDGQTIGPLGPIGAVRRDVLLEPAALLRRANARQ